MSNARRHRVGATVAAATTYLLGNLRLLSRSATLSTHHLGLHSLQCPPLSPPSPPPARAPDVRTSAPPLPFSGVSPCYDMGESYAASWLIRSDSLLSFWGYLDLQGRSVRFDRDSVVSPGWSSGRNVTYAGGSMMMETASFLMFARSGRRTFRTVDALDFMVEHWSSVERRGARPRAIEGDELREEAARQIAGIVRRRERSLAEEWRSAAESRRSASAASGNGYPGDRVVAVVPFYSGSDGPEGSALPETLEARLLYLNATYFSVSRYFPHVAVMVTNDADRTYCVDRSGLPFSDVVLIDGLPGPNFLPLATVVEMHRRFRTGEWSRFDYAYYTESDQVLHLRPHQLKSLLDVPSKDGAGYFKSLVPHRFMVLQRPSLDFDRDFLANVTRSNPSMATEIDALDAKRAVDIRDEGRFRCCFRRGDNCTYRDHWMPMFGENTGTRNESRTEEGRPRGRVRPEAHLLRLSNSVTVANGNGNEFKMMFRTCAVQQGGACP